MLKKKSALIVLSCLIFILIACVMVSCSNKTPSNRWNAVVEFSEYEDLFGSPIREITLRETVDSSEWVVFSDTDLLEKWQTYFSGLEVKRERQLSDSEMEVNGGISVVTVNTEGSTFTFYLRSDSGEMKMEIDGYLYAIKSRTELPFDETYREAQARHGIKTPWDDG